MGKIIEMDGGKTTVPQVEQRFSNEGTEFVIIYKDSLFWISKGVRWKGNYGTTYQIVKGLEHNGFEGVSDAYSYLTTLIEGNDNVSI